MPGIHDAHTHLLGAATQQLSEALIGTNSDHLTLGPNIKTASCHCEYAHTLGEWIVASFYSALQFPDGKDSPHLTRINTDSSTPKANQIENTSTPPSPTRQSPSATLPCTTASSTRKP